MKAMIEIKHGRHGRYKQTSIRHVCIFGANRGILFVCSTKHPLDYFLSVCFRNVRVCAARPMTCANLVDVPTSRYVPFGVPTDSRPFGFRSWKQKNKSSKKFITNIQSRVPTTCVFYRSLRLSRSETLLYFGEQIFSSSPEANGRVLFSVHEREHFALCERIWSVQIVFHHDFVYILTSKTIVTNSCFAFPGRPSAVYTGRLLHCVVPKSPW